MSGVGLAMVWLAACLVLPLVLALPALVAIEMRAAARARHPGGTDGSFGARLASLETCPAGASRPGLFRGRRA